MNKRPLAVTLISCLYIVAGTVGLIFHLSDFKSLRPFDYQLVLIELVRLLAIVAGAYMLRGTNWARWLAIVWMAFHVILSVFHSWPEFAFHAVLCIVLVYFLFRPPGSQYFQASKPA